MPREPKCNKSYEDAFHCTACLDRLGRCTNTSKSPKKLADTEAQPIQRAEPRYPENIMKTLRECRDLDENDTAQDRDINTLTPNEVFDAILNFEGIIGYDYKIKRWIQDIYKVDLDEVR